VLAPSTGALLFDGKAPSGDKTELRRQIGFLGDGNPLYKHMTPAEYLRFFGQCFKLPTAALDTAIDDMLTTFDLVDKRDTPSGALSKGMRQRLLIARCLLHGPRLLILDEPADGLDPRGRSELRAILARTRDRGVTVLISSHILRELDDLCDQMAILQQGKLVVAGDVADIIQRHEVRRFVYQLRLLSGGPAAREVLLRQRALIEAEGFEEGCETLSIQVQGGEELMADILAELVTAGVRVVTVSRVRSRLEDVYNRLSEDRVA
jgi:ABC-2 type transport system ATP-binding protein